MPFNQESVQNKIKQLCENDEEFKNIWDEIDDILYITKGLIKQEKMYLDENDCEDFQKWYDKSLDSLEKE